jgi:hypothetical protein
VEAYRVTPNRPDDVAQLRYNDADGVRANVGNNPERQLNMLMAQGDVEWSVRDESDRPLALERARRSLDSTLSIVGRKGMRYVLEFRNLSGRTYEVVATVDGLDVMSGQPGSTSNRGYEPPRLLRRLLRLRMEPYEDVPEVFPRGDRARSAHGL